MILGLDRNICEMLIWNTDMRRFVLLLLEQKLIINNISNVTGTMDARKHFLVVLLSAVAFLAAVEAGKYGLMTTRFDKYG